MFFPGYWAAAFINSLEDQGAEPAAGINILRLFAAWAKSLPGAVSGDSGAAELEKLAREAVLRTGNESPAAETALRFIVLMVRKNRVSHIAQVIEEAKKILDKKNGVVKVSVEYALPPDEDFIHHIEEAVKRKTGADKVELDKQINPDLIGGFRLRMEDEVIDASVRAQLRNLETVLTAGISGSANGSALRPAVGGQ